MSTAKLYSKGSRVWLKDPDTVWRGAVVSKDFTAAPGVLSLEMEDDPAETEDVKIAADSDLPHLRNPDILIGMNDLTSLSYLHEPAVLHNLSVRFMNYQNIYTYCGIVLVAINPYEELHIYGSDTIMMYRGKNMGDLDPHIYAVSEEAFTKMERDDMNQSIIVSGESGAGKTVSAKYAMRYFATVGGTSQTETQVEKRVLASSPIMEAIGNAKTTRNDNSSRFGKYIEIDFNKHFHIIGANMRTYLLEKSRVVFQAPEERNYHVFYQMCAGREEEEILKGLYLDEPDSFAYLNQGQAPEIDGVDDLKEFGITHEAFRLLGFDSKEIGNIYKILAGILQLGNVEIEAGSTGRGPDSESSVIESGDLGLKRMAELFQIEEEQIKKWLCNRKIITARETFTKPMPPSDALFARDALAKCVYANLFDWIVAQVNKSLRTSGKIHKFIGVLDIYGFETFEINSFEQFCINYANEKLQQQFNMHVFKLEQEDYIREAIEWKMIDFYDNQPCIDLIESKLGILDLLDEECKIPKGSDKSWVEKLYDRCKKWQHFEKPRLSQTAFLVKHFADKVEYESAGFLDKNRDTVMEEQLNILKASNNDLLSELFLEQKAAPKSSGTPKIKAAPPTSSLKKNKRTVGSQFHDSLSLLMKTLNSTTPHYVRCIKPNDQKAAFEFDPKRAVQQLRACGVLETVRISAAGYPSRWTYYDFFMRYRVLCHSKDIKRNDYRTTCEKIAANMIQDEDKYRFGKTKLFFRAGQVAYMEKLRSEKLRDCGIMIQKYVKGWLYRKRYIKIQKAALCVQRWSRGFIARRRVRYMRRTQAAVTIQRYFRGWIARSSYNRIRASTVRLQARIRGYNARKQFADIVRHNKAIIIQRNVRGWLARKHYARQLKRVVLIQCLVRRRLAKKQLKKLKIEAKSVDHQKQLNKGLENKIITLQQQLNEVKNDNKNLKESVKDHQKAVKELENLRKSDSENKAGQKRILELEEELLKVKSDLDREKGEKVDLVNERANEVSAFKAKEDELKAAVATLEAKMSAKLDEEKENFAAAEMTKKFEAEKAGINAEYEQERIAYQRLLKDYNRLEAQFENLQDEMSAIRGDGAASSMSMVSSLATVEMDRGDESAYGSVSGRSSMRSSGGPAQHERPRLDQIEWKEGQTTEDVGLTLKLQQKLKETQKDKEKLEKRLEELEAAASPTNEKQTADGIRLQELEVENNQLKQDLKNIRASIAENTDDSSLKELVEQYEHLQDELDRRREECVQLRTVLANASSLDGHPFSSLVTASGAELPEAEELFTAYETQKKVISQLQESLNDERARAKELETDLRAEAEKLAKTCNEQQAVINSAINAAVNKDSGSGGANNIEACLQHEITRLTGENFDLREKIENLTETTKRLKRQLKIYMKKLSEQGVGVSELGGPTFEIGGTVTNLNDSEGGGAGAGGGNVDSPMPMIRKKDHDYLGMFEYRREQEQQILRAMIYDLKPKISVQMLPGLPAYVLFMMIRYTDHTNNDEYVRTLIQGAIGLIKKVIKKKGLNDLEVKTLWLSNMLRLIHNLKQYSGESQFQAESTQKQIDQCLRNFDLTEYRRVLSDVAVWIYQGITRLIEEEIQPVLVPAVLEHDGIAGISEAGSKPVPPRQRTASSGGELDTPAYVDPKEALEQLLKLLTRFHNTFIKHGLDPEMISQIFRQVYYFVCAGALNNLLLRKDMCHWSRGMQIRYNVAQLEQWARDQKVHDDNTGVIDSMLPIVQATQLLQSRKSDEDVQAICDMCTHLKVSQIIKILNLYTPANEFEERVTPSFVRKVQANLAERKAEEDAAKTPTLLMDTKYAFAVRFPFNPSNIQLEELEIPEIYNDLHTMLNKI